MASLALIVSRFSSMEMSRRSEFVNVLVGNEVINQLFFGGIVNVTVSTDGNLKRHGISVNKSQINISSIIPHRDVK